MQLKSPITVNGVSMCNQRLNFVSFQLNTLNMNNNQGIKNLVYYDMDNELYLNRPTVNKLPYPTMKNIQRLALRHLECNQNSFKKLYSVLSYDADSF
jgi:hypothetical protein